VATDFDRALDAARAADSARASGKELPPLHGLPMTIKDAIETAHLVTTGGNPEYKDHLPARDADPVARLKAAGVIIFGKTNVPYMSGDWQSYNAIYGTTGNPFNPALTPGGSSGGAAAALAAGISPADIGSDVGGSIRIPAHFCGIFGHKPSFGLVPKRGHLPPAPGILSEAPLSVIGPLGRSAADLELILGVIAGPRPQDKAMRLALPAPRRTRPKGLKVAVWADDAFSPVAADCAAAVRRAGEALAQDGASVDYDARPELDFAIAHETYSVPMHGLMSADFPAKARAALARRADKLAPDDTSHAALQARGAALSFERSLYWDNERARLMAVWARFFRSYDVLLCPPTNIAAFAHDHSADFWNRTIDVDGAARPYGDLMHWAGLATGADLPATAAPAGSTADGLPVGVQIIGPYQEDLTPIAVAAMLEERLGGFTPPGGFA
jgi:amidase